MHDKQPTYERAAVTEHPAELLARKHGFENLAHLAETLPRGAEVIDVGAGASQFGSEVGSLRPDIHWTNFDINYRDEALLEEQCKIAPDNVEYIAGDATRLTDYYAPSTFDATFSYGLLPHLSLEQGTLAKEAAMAMHAITKVGGLLSVGPRNPLNNLIALRSGVSVRAVKDSEDNTEAYGRLILEETKLPRVNAYAQKLMNDVATPFFGTTRYVRRDDGAPKIMHPESGEYVSRLSPKGLATMGRLAVAIARQATTEKKRKK